MPKRTAIFTAIIVVLCTVLAAAEAPKSKTTSTAKQLDEMLGLYNKFGQFNGSVLVARDGRVLYEKGFGYANFEWKVPNTPQTRFRIASVTKTFTAALVLQEVERGHIDLDAPITKYVPGYRADTGNRVTIRQMLAHSSGLPNYTSSPKWMAASRSEMSQDDFVHNFCFGDLTFEPGTSWNYSNCAYFLLGMAVEKVTGKTYEALLSERILVPLGMTNTGVDHNTALLPMRGYGYRKTLAREYEPSPYLDLGQAFGAGDIYSTVEDLCKWDQALYSDKILSAKTRELMFTKASLRSGLGWFVEKAPEAHPAAGRTLQFHEGYVYGWLTLITRIPEERLFVAIINNTGDAPLEKITQQITNVVLHGQYDRPKQSVVDLIAPILLKQSATAAVAEYKRLKASSPDQMDFSERPLNSFGYELMRAGRTKDAVEMLKLNVEMYPQSANALDSLGEAYERNGQVDLAIANFEKAVALDPQMKSSEAGLKRLKPVKAGAAGD